jgi:hypothetical protein
MTKLPTIIAALVLVAGPMAPQPANAWVWFVAKQLAKQALPSPKPEVRISGGSKEYAKPPRPRSPDRYSDSERESRYKRF